MTNMKSRAAHWVLSILILGLPGRVLAFCHELEVVQGRVIRVAASNAAPVLVEWLGHATFQITSSKGTRILTDPHGAFDLPRPTLPQHIVTTSHPHGPHSSVHMAPGTGPPADAAAVEHDGQDRHPARAHRRWLLHRYRE
ncbi:MAG: MBL fold metallo-hydrolase [Deltaproteobacteria bacterium]|nr:MBL fold metallo-hydrolase [Deltaproteobacteria bacterium]